MVHFNNRQNLLSVNYLIFKIVDNKLFGIFLERKTFLIGFLAFSSQVLGKKSPNVRDKLGGCGLPPIVGS